MILNKQQIRGHTPGEPVIPDPDYSAIDMNRSDLYA